MNLFHDSDIGSAVSYVVSCKEKRNKNNRFRLKRGNRFNKVPICTTVSIHNTTISVKTVEIVEKLPWIITVISQL